MGTNGKCYHLPKRYTPRDKKEDEDEPKKKKKNGKGEEEVTNEDEVQDADELQWEGEVKDVKVEQEEIEALPTVGRHPKAKHKIKSKKRDVEAADKKKEEMLKKREELPTAPNPEMLKEGTKEQNYKDGTLVNYLPYESIDVIFNMHNLWANHQNHHPALITYDFDVPEEE